MSNGTEPEFLIQVEETGGARLESSGREVIKASDKQLDAAAELAHRASDKLSKVFASAGPDSGSVEFALSFEGEAGLPVLAKGKVGTSITVTLNWGKS